MNEDQTIIESVASTYGVKAQTIKTRWNRWINSACIRAGMSGIDELSPDQYKGALISYGNACSESTSRTVRENWERDWAARHKVERTESIEGELVDNDTAVDLAQDLDVSALAVRQEESVQLLDDLREQFYLSNPLSGLAHVVVSQMAPQAEVFKREVAAQTFRLFAGAANDGRKEGTQALLEELALQARQNTI
jgi:hypothetical protein